jgi:hypothetical protein
MLARYLVKTALVVRVAIASLTYRGVDWSSVGVEEQAGITYKSSSGVVQPLEQILAANGVNIVRQRVWVNPSGGTYGQDYNVALAKRAKAAGLGVYLDLHLSDTWADAGHQSIPSGWPTDIDNLSWRLYNYTLALGNAFQSAGVQPQIISLGNESECFAPMAKALLYLLHRMTAQALFRLFRVLLTRQTSPRGFALANRRDVLLCKHREAASLRVLRYQILNTKSPA